jgi:annexin A7/11
MKGLGTNEDMLTRLTIRCREPHLMAAIKDAYSKAHGSTLRKRIEGETGGNYRDLLLAIVGN